MSGKILKKCNFKMGNQEIKNELFEKKEKSTKRRRSRAKLWDTV